MSAETIELKTVQIHKDSRGFVTIEAINGHLRPQELKVEIFDEIQSLRAKVALHESAQSAAPLTCEEGQELARLRNFKAYVHERLDKAGVPVDPPSPHREAGCRIGGRLDAVLKPPGFGISCTVAWTELAQALRADGHVVHDKSGPTVRKWIEDVVRDTFLPNAQALQSARLTITKLMDAHKFNTTRLPAAKVHEQLASTLVQLCPTKTDACTWPDCGHDGNGVGQTCCIDIERARIGGPPCNFPKCGTHEAPCWCHPPAFTLVPNAEDGDFDCPKAAAARECPCGFCKALREPADSWKAVVLDALANTGMDAPKSEHPRSILARVIRWHEDAVLKSPPVDPRIVDAFRVLLNNPSSPWRSRSIMSILGAQL